METTSPRISSGSGSEQAVPPSPRKSRSSTLAAILSCTSASAHSDATDGSDDEQSSPTSPQEAQSPRRIVAEGGSDAVLPRGGSPDATAAATATTRAADSLRGMLVIALPSRKLMSLFLRREFAVDAASEPLVYDASCALREGPLLSQGRLFVFSSRIFFYSNVFGITRRQALPFSSVTGFAKRRLAAKGAFGALEVTCVDGKAVTLVSFWDRSKALRVLQTTWQAWKDDPRNAVPASSSDATAEESPRSSSSSGSTDGPPSRSPSARSMPVVIASSPPPPLDGLTQLQLTDDGPTMQLPCTLGGIYTLCLSDGSNFLQVRVMSDPLSMSWLLTPRRPPPGVPRGSRRAGRGGADVERRGGCPRAVRDVAEPAGEPQAQRPPPARHPRLHPHPGAAAVHGLLP